MLKCPREQRADKCRNMESGVRVREARPSWLEDNEQEVGGDEVGEEAGWTVFLVKTVTLLVHQQQSSIVFSFTSADGYLNLFPNSEYPLLYAGSATQRFLHTSGSYTSSPASTVTPFPREKGDYPSPSPQLLS